MTKQHLFFDLDGTIIDSSKGIIASIQYALEKMDLPPRSFEELLVFIGPPIQFSFQEYIGLNEEQAKKAITFYREYYVKHALNTEGNKVYDGLIELLQKLEKQEKSLYIATSKPEHYAKQVLENLQLTHFFQGIYGSSMDQKRSKKADVLAYALQEEGITDPSNCYMIGDKIHDLIGAKENNMEVIGVLWGFGNRKELSQEKTVAIVRQPKELLEILS